MFLSADVLGHRADLFCAGRDYSVARAVAIEEVNRDAARQLCGEDCALRFDDCVPMVSSRGGDVARLGPWLRGGGVGADST